MGHIFGVSPFPREAGGLVAGRLDGFRCDASGLFDISFGVGKREKAGLELGGRKIDASLETGMEIPREGRSIASVRIREIANRSFAEV